MEEPTTGALIEPQIDGEMRSGYVLAHEELMAGHSFVDAMYLASATHVETIRALSPSRTTRNSPTDVA